MGFLGIAQSIGSSIGRLASATVNLAMDKLGFEPSLPAHDFAAAPLRFTKEVAAPVSAGIKLDWEPVISAATAGSSNNTVSRFDPGLMSGVRIPSVDPEPITYDGPSLRARTPADQTSVTLKPETTRISDAMFQYRQRTGFQGGMTTLEAAMNRGIVPDFALPSAMDLVYDPGPGGRFMRNAGKVPLGLVDQVEVTKPDTLGEHLGAGAGTLARGVRDLAALSYVIPTVVPAPGSGLAGKLAAAATANAAYGAELANMETLWNAPFDDRLANTAYGALSGAAFGVGAAGVGLGYQATGRYVSGLIDDALLPFPNTPKINPLPRALPIPGALGRVDDAAEAALLQHDMGLYKTKLGGFGDLSLTKKQVQLLNKKAWGMLALYGEEDAAVSSRWQYMIGKPPPIEEVLAGTKIPKGLKGVRVMVLAPEKNQLRVTAGISPDGTTLMYQPPVPSTVKKVNENLAKGMIKTRVSAEEAAIKHEFEGHLPAIRSGKYAPGSNPDNIVIPTRVAKEAEKLGSSEEGVRHVLYSADSGEIAADVRANREIFPWFSKLPVRRQVLAVLKNRGLLKEGVSSKSVDLLDYIVPRVRTDLAKLGPGNILTSKAFANRLNQDPAVLLNQTHFGPALTPYTEQPYMNWLGGAYTQ